MSQWHREHPELTGTDADPCMANAGYAQAVAQGGCSDAWIAEYERRSLIFDCDECGAADSIDCAYKLDPTGVRRFHDYYGACDECAIEFIYDADPPGSLHLRYPNKEATDG